MLILALFDYLGTFAFAVSGAPTAIGGGTIRDVMLGERPLRLDSSQSA